MMRCAGSAPTSFSCAAPLRSPRADRHAPGSAVSRRLQMTTSQRPASSRIAATPESNGSPMGIGEVAKTVGLSPSTLRAWEAAGLSTPQRDAWGRRWYSRSESKRLHEIKRFREEEGLSLREINQRLIERHVAERTDLSASYVSSVENGSIRPSVSGLLKLSQVYGANILSFYGPSPEPRRRLVRSGEAEVIAMGDPGVGVALLTPHEGAIELHFFELGPGASSGGSYRHDGDEFWYVLSGTLSVWVDDEFFRLEAGDCLSFASTDEHRFANLTQGVTTFLGGNTPSTF